MLVALLESVPAYDPNEISLKVAGLKTYQQELLDANVAVNDALFVLSDARYQRNALQFMPQTGLVDVSLDFKKYIKSVYGGDSHQYKTIGSLEFVRYKFVPAAPSA